MIHDETGARNEAVSFLVTNRIGYLLFPKHFLVIEDLS
jgi:hypothetical protein